MITEKDIQVFSREHDLGYAAGCSVWGKRMKRPGWMDQEQSYVFRDFNVAHAMYCYVMNIHDRGVTLIPVAGTEGGIREKDWLFIPKETIRSIYGERYWGYRGLFMETERGIFAAKIPWRVKGCGWQRANMKNIWKKLGKETGWKWSIGRK